MAVRRWRWKYVPPFAVMVMSYGLWTVLLYPLAYFLDRHAFQSDPRLRVIWGAPLLLVALAGLLLAQCHYYVRPQLRAKRLLSAGRLPCMWCGYDLAALDDKGGWPRACPECGERVAHDEMEAYWRRLRLLNDPERVSPTDTHRACTRRRAERRPS